jgi:hypothetical protein
LQHAGATPRSFTFGAACCGAGFWDSDTGNIFRVGGVYFALVTEVALEAPAKSAPKKRDDATYFTVITLRSLTMPRGYVRSSSRACVEYWVNSIMIEAYGMDPLGLIQNDLLRPDVRAPASHRHVRDILRRLLLMSRLRRSGSKPLAGLVESTTSPSSTTPSPSEPRRSRVPLTCVFLPAPARSHGDAERSDRARQVRSATRHQAPRATATVFSPAVR